MSDVIPTVGVLVFKEDKVLLVRHENQAEHLEGVYGLPAGRLEEGEQEIDGALRELKEETNLESEKTGLLKMPKTYFADILRKNGQIKRFSLVVFVTNEVSGDIQSNGETTPKWVQLDTINTMNLLPNVLEIIADAKQQFG